MEGKNRYSELRRSSSSSSCSSDELEMDSCPMESPKMPRPSGKLEVKAKITVNAGGTGVHNGDLFTLNQFIGVTPGERMDVEAVKDLISEAVRIKTETKRQFLAEENSHSWSCIHKMHVKDGSEHCDHSQESCSCWVMATLLIGLIPLVSTTLFSTLTTPHRHEDVAATSAGSHTKRSGETADKSSKPNDGRQAKQYSNYDIINMKDGPRIFPRMFWCAQPPTGPLDRLVKPARRVVVCHTITEGCDTTPDCIKGVRYIQQYHINCRGWCDIGYNFVIGGDGNVYTGRGWDWVGQHTKGENTDSLGIGFLGTYLTEMPKHEMVEAFHKLVAVGVKAGKISEDYSLVAQCQLTLTSSPGLPLAREMTSWPHFDLSLPIRCPSVGDIDV